MTKYPRTKKSARANPPAFGIRHSSFSLRVRMALSVMLLCLWLAHSVFAKSFVYISVAGEKRIAVYAREPATGKLTHLSDARLDGEPGALTINRERSLLFASIRSTGELASFRVDPGNGGLELLSVVSAGADPAYVALDQRDRFLLSAYYRAAKVMVHRIGDDGKIGVPPVQELPTADKAHAILADRSNRFVFVPHTGPNVIFQFAFDEDGGQLRPGNPARLQRPENTGPRHLSFHPTRDFAYASDEQGNSITFYRFLANEGRLEPVQTESTLPAAFAERNSTAHLEVHPSGRFVYVANRGHDSLAGFRIDAATGRLTALGQTGTEATPRSFNCSPGGEHLYAAGQSTGKLAVFAVDRASGALTRIETYDVGQRPWWVMVVGRD